MRKRREILDGFSYHITARINRQEFLFESNEVKEMFMDVLRRAKRKHHFLIKNFCIMNNHIHFILKPLRGESLSKIMQWVLGVFAQKYNKIFGLSGHVWSDRFKSKIIKLFALYLIYYVKKTSSLIESSRIGEKSQKQANSIDIAQASIISFKQYLNTFIYIANNPVKAGIVTIAVDFRYSGISDIQKGYYDIMERPPNKVLRKIWEILQNKTNQ